MQTYNHFVSVGKVMDRFRLSAAAINFQGFTMQVPDYLMIVPASAAGSILVLALLGIVVLYMARKPAHQTILSVSKTLFRAFRLFAASVLMAEQKLKARNKEVLLASGKIAAEHAIEREFERIDDFVKKDLSYFPTLQHDIAASVVRLDEDFQKSAEVPPAPPGWTKAIEPIATIPPSEDSMVAEILKSIKDALERGQSKALEAYRAGTHQRHMQLKQMIPTLRHINQALGGLDKNVRKLLERTATIDRQMDDYDRIVKKSDKAAEMLSSSAMTQFVIAGFVLAIAVGGALINFNLIARPMQEMVGGSVHMMGYRVADIAALVIVLVEISMGLFLMESLRITRLFPAINTLEERIRIRMIIVSFVFLLLLASVEAGLAYMRELLSADDAALVAGLLAGNAAPPAAVNDSGRWITTAAQMGMGFILPFALTFIAIPLESFVHSSRTVLGMLLEGALRMFAVTLRFAGNVSKYAGYSLVSLYDLIIFMPLWVEGAIKGGMSRKRRSEPAAPAAKTAAAVSDGQEKVKASEEDSGEQTPKKRPSRRRSAAKTTAVEDVTEALAAAEAKEV